MKARQLAVFGVLLAATASVALAAEGRIPIYQPTTITAPGDYILTRDIDLGTSGGSAITITADGVNLDLNGKTILSDGGNDLIVLNYASPDVIGTTIRNGTILGGYAAIYAPPVGSRRLTLENLHISDTGATGIELNYVRALRIAGCTIHGTGMSAIYADGVSGAFPAIIENNIITDSEGSGIEIAELRGAVIRGNVIDGFGTDGGNRHGIYLIGESGYLPGGNLIAGNTVRGGAGTNSGIYIGSALHDNVLEHNVVTANGDHGFHILSHRNRVTDCIASDNGTDGFYFTGDYNLIERCTASSNGDHGLSCGNYGNAFRDNNLRNNTTAATDTMVCEFDTDAGGNLF
jgi:parallel beta-helix repeat protein